MTAPEPAEQAVSGVIELHSPAPRAEPVPQVRVCTLDGRDITAPGERLTGEVLAVVRKVGAGGMTRHQVLEFLEAELGAEQLDAVLSSDMTQEQFDAISARVLVIALGGDPDADASGNGRTGPLRSVG